MKNYSELSDIEINIMVSKSLYGELSNWHKGELNEGVIDYCNKAEDAWPIIVENGINVFNDISLIEFLDHARASATHPDVAEGSVISNDKNPLRAAMIVYLMMKDSENA